MTSLQIMAVLASAVAIALTLIWYTMGGEKKEKSKANIILTQLKYPMIQAVAFSEEKPVTLNQEIAQQPITGTPAITASDTIITGDIKTEPTQVENIQSEPSQMTVKVEPLPERESEQVGASETVQEKTDAPGIKDGNITKEVKAKGTGRRRAGASRRKKTAKQEPKTPQ